MLKVSREGANLTVEVQKVGTYFLTANEASRQLTLQSPVAGVYNYDWDQASQFWKSTQETHILEELLVREFCHHTRGWL